MAIPLEIRITEHEMQITASPVPYALSMSSTLEFGFLVEFDGAEVLMTPYEFACHDESCRPPRSGGTGGSKSGGAAAGGVSTIGADAPKTSHAYAPKKGHIGSAEDASDIAVVSKKVAGSLRSDGILSESWLNEKGEVVLTPKQEAGADAKLKALGTSEAEWVSNVKTIALEAMKDPKRTAKDAAWYQDEHDNWGAPLAKKHGITIEQVMGIASATSTNKTWDGVKSSNKETVENILNLLKEDRKITITKEQADAYNQFSIDKPSGGGKYGPKAIEPGDFKLSQLSSGTLARVMGSGYNIGGQYFTDGLFKAFSIARGELEPNVAIGSLKQRSFVNNLSHPEIDYSSTNDFWMARAVFGNGKLHLDKGPAKTVREWEKSANDKPNSFLGTTGTGSSSLFAVATRASKTALRELQATDKRFKGMKTHEFQAVVWVQMQRQYAANGWG